MEFIVRRLSEEALLTRPGDEITQNYASRTWPMLLNEEPKELVYNRDRQRFELAEFGQWFGSWLQGRVNTQPMKEILRDSRTIIGRYGLTVGVWYTWEHSKKRMAERVTDIAEFIYFKVPQSEYIPGLEKLAGWDELESD